MSQPYVESLPSVDPSVATRLSTLRVATGSADLFPIDVHTLQPERVHALNQQALLALGALGVEDSYQSMTAWYKDQAEQEEKLAAALMADPLSLDAAVQTAARYATAQRFKLVTPRDTAADRNHAKYMSDPSYASLYRASLTYSEKPVVKDTLQLRRISLFGAKLFERSQNS